MYRSHISIGVKFLNHRITDVHENGSNFLLFSSKQNGSSLKLNLISSAGFKVHQDKERTNWFMRQMLFAPMIRALEVLGAFWSQCRCLSVALQASLSEGPRERRLWSAKLGQGLLLMAGVRASSGAVNTKKSLSKELPVASNLWQCRLQCWVRC